MTKPIKKKARPKKTSGLSTSEALFKLTALTEASAAINSHRQLPLLLKSVMREAEKVMHAEASSVFLVDEKANELFFEVATGPRGDAVQRIRLKMGEGIA